MSEKMMTKDEALAVLNEYAAGLERDTPNCARELAAARATLAQQLQAQAAEAAELDRRRRLAGEEAARLQERASSLFDKLVAANARAEAAEADARRYRWLRNKAWRYSETGPAVAVFDARGELVSIDCDDDELDAAIDALLNPPVDPATINAGGESERDCPHSAFDACDCFTEGREHAD
jgi:chromosome segregation ATPase